MPLRKYNRTIELKSDADITLKVGGSASLFKIEHKAGIVRQITFRFATVTGVKLIIIYDREHKVEFPTGTQIITNFTMTTPYAPECIYSPKSAASPYVITSTYRFDFEDSLEVILQNVGTSTSAVTDAFMVVDLYTDEHKKEKEWID